MVGTEYPNYQRQKSGDLKGFDQKGSYQCRLPYDTLNQLKRGNGAKQMYKKGGLCGVSLCKL
jgi:hypothetical protein